MDIDKAIKQYSDRELQENILRVTVRNESHLKWISTFCTISLIVFAIGVVATLLLITFNH